MESAFSSSRWIWNADENHPRNRWVVFRKEFIPSSAEEGVQWQLNLTADARYHLWVNGIWRGEGPSRSWPDELFFDSYDLTDVCRSCESIEIRILVHHFTPGTSNYIVGRAGCAAEILKIEKDRSAETVLVTDSSWESSPHPGYREEVVKMSNGLGYNEVYRADCSAMDSRWLWTPSLDCGPALSNQHRIIPRDIPPLEETLLPPAGINGRRRTTKEGLYRSVNLRPLVYPDDKDINKHKRFSGILDVGIESPCSAGGRIGLTLDPHDTEALMFSVGEENFSHKNGESYPLTLEKGVTRLRILVRGEYHDPVIHISFLFPEELRLVSLDQSDSNLAENTSPFRFCGPFGPTHHLQVSEPIPPAEEEVLSESALLEKDQMALNGDLPFIPVPEDCVSEHHVPLECLSAAPLSKSDDEFFQLSTPERIQFPVKSAWGDGEREQILWDFGRECSGFPEFTVDCPAGTRIDLFCFESFHDGILEHTWSLNNSIRYIAGEGRQSYTVFQRRGFRYILMILDGGGGRAQIEDIHIRERLYPTRDAGRFNCSDERLNRIWDISSRTVSLCMEDTYVDCPAFEQTYWTGDTRNSALYSYYLFNAGPLFLRSAKLAARSLERSPLFESTVPSAWQNIIPSWSFFHVIAAVEYRYYSGDETGFNAVYPSLFKNMENAAGRRIEHPDGGKLFALHAWNMLDWAPMDVPDDGIIAHQNAQFVIACRALAKAASEAGRSEDALRLGAWADETAKAASVHFWNRDKEAFCDCLSRDFVQSDTFSVQTQIFMYMMDPSDENHGPQIKDKILNPPEDFVRIGSPFVQHFYLELLCRWGQLSQILDEIRAIWGHMIDCGATSCWEGWKLIPGHYTRSHCHAWSAAPSYFFPIVILGITPMDKGFRKVRIAPFPDTLDRAEGSLMTPSGPLSVSWHMENHLFNIEIIKPKEMDVVVEVPKNIEMGSLILNDVIE